MYAERLLAILDPDGRLIDHKLYRDSCLNVEGNYLKDLNVLGRDLTRTVLVDNSPHAFGYQLDNGIPIESWFDDRADTELLKLIKFLETIQVGGVGAGGGGWSRKRRANDGIPPAVSTRGPTHGARVRRGDPSQLTRSTPSLPIAVLQGRTARRRRQVWRA